MDTAFRKIDIDQFDEDILHESELYDADTRDPSQILEEAKQRQVAVRTSLAKGDVVGALSTILENPPYGPNVDQAKDITLQTLLTILNTTKATEIPAVIKSLSQDAQDTLMKYLYKGMAMPGWGDISGSVLLGWHEKLTEIAGTGCICVQIDDRPVELAGRPSEFIISPHAIRPLRDSVLPSPKIQDSPALFHSVWLPIIWLLVPVKYSLERKDKQTQRVIQEEDIKKNTVTDHSLELNKLENP
ncbi:hypothetical protein LshimejAT787_1701880 [Lyophyllum shimeji]|uniref:Actin-related protein 2/3 complex subunit 5 n=1 Tax=Lyophyllum shimeji TaxID=47721 RepID=A0A9P3UVX0_LYOSH|nr:hypothetical protein LshimejAT787_1701880 [Lyophyllum shimeji]